MTRRLLFVVNIPRFFVSHRLPLALAARDAGYDVHVATADGDEDNIAVIVAHGLALHRIPLEQHGTHLMTELRTFLALVRLFRRVKPDIVHLVTIKPVLYGGLAARLTRRNRVIAAMSGLGRAFRDDRGAPRHPGRTLVAALRVGLPARTSHVLVQNSDDLTLLRELGIADPAASSVIAGSGVDLDEFRPSPRGSDTTTTFLYAGRLMRQKGLEDFVEVARRLRGSARFKVAGYSEQGSPDAVPVSQVEEWAEQGLIEWLGARTDMPQVIADCDVVVLPSVYGEGVPRTLIEAAASGRAIITTDMPGCRDICQDGVNGLLVAPGDVDALERAASTLLDDPARLSRMGAAGRALAEERFGLREVLARTLDLYAQMLGEH